MDISKIVLISDMDGTLLNNKKEITEKDMTAIRGFIEKGGRFTVATGRTVQSFAPFYEKLELKFPLIMYNGAAIYDSTAKEFLYTQTLPKTARDYTKRILDAMPHIGGEVLKTDGIFVFRNTDYEKLHTKLTGVTPEYAELDDIHGDWLKVLFSMAPEDVLKMEILVKNLNLDSVDFVRTAEILFEMLPKGSSKGSALSQYRKLPGMEDCFFVAVGDFNNDIEMLLEADLGVAPSNAVQEVIEVADAVLDNSCDTGAIAETVELIYERIQQEL